MACGTCNKVRAVINTAARTVGIKAQLPMLTTQPKTGVNPMWQKIMKGTK